MDEIFLEDEETGLLVSNLGRVFGPEGVELKAEPGQRGHLRVRYGRKNGKELRALVHRLVARNFLPNPLNHPVVNHKDENPSNNRVDNLEWCSVKYNDNYGMRNRKISATHIRKGQTRKCILQKNGETIYANSLHEMARLIGSTPRNVLTVIQGKVTQTLGWHLPGITPIRKMGNITLWKGAEKVVFESVSSAAKIIGCSHSSISHLVHGKISCFRGWTYNSHSYATVMPLT